MSSTLKALSAMATPTVAFIAWEALEGVALTEVATITMAGGALTTVAVGGVVYGVKWLKREMHKKACREKAELIVITLADAEELRKKTEQRGDSDERVMSQMAELFFLSDKVASGIHNYVRRAERSEDCEGKTFFDHCLDYANATMHILLAKDNWPQVHYENHALGAMMKKSFESKCLRRREFAPVIRVLLEEACKHMAEVSALERRVGDFRRIGSSLKPDATAVKRIVMLGPTRCGKSTLGNLLLGDESEFRDEGPFDVSEGAKAQVRKELHKSGLFSVTDTCGSDHTEGRDDEFITAMIKSLEGIGHVNCFLLVLSFPGGATPSVRALFERMNDMFGDGVWKHVVLVLTNRLKVRDESVLARSWEELTRTVPAAARVLPPIVYLDALHDSAVGKARHLLEDILPKMDDFKCDLLRSPFDVANEQLTVARLSLDQAMTQLNKELVRDKIFALSILKMLKHNGWTLEAGYRFDAEHKALSRFPNEVLLRDAELSKDAKELLCNETERS